MTNAVNTLRSRLFMAASLLVASSAAFAGTVPPADMHTSALGYESTLQSSGMAERIGAVGGVTGNGSAAYDNKQAVARFDGSAILAPSILEPTLTVHAKGIATEVTSSGLGVDSISAQANASVDDVHAVMTMNPPPTAAHTPGQQALVNLTATGLTAMSNFDLTLPSTTTATGTASVGSLDISGSIFGKTKIHYSGTPGPNTVIYSSPTVTVTVNKQVEEVVITCPTPTSCTSAPMNIRTRAVDVAFDKAPMFGQLVSGNIVVGEALAQ